MQKFLSNQNKLLLILSIVIFQIFLFKPIQVLADLPTGNAVKDPNAILRNALPIKQVELQEIQHKLEETSDLVRGALNPSTIACIFPFEVFIFTFALPSSLGRLSNSAGIS